jgi:acyl-CoA thioester hydrolase
MYIRIIMRYHETNIKVRFNEIDAYRVAWHGHYVAWMEVGRNELAGRFELSADQLYAAGFLAPVVSLELKFLRPARLDEELLVRTSLRRAETATLEFHSTIVGADGTIRASGRTVHALTDMAGELQFTLTPEVRERLERMLAWLELP